MRATRNAARAELTPYEDEQVREIAAWKSTPPNPFAEMFKSITLPGARVVESVVPDALVRQAIERAYDASELLAGREDIARQAGVDDIDELRDRPFEECDRLANRVAVASQSFAAAEGAATGAGGPLTTLLDVPVLFVLAIRTIIRVGHCYGYRLDAPRDRQYVLAVLLAATSNSLETRRMRLDRLQEVEDWLLEETQQDIVAEEVASFLFQLEVFEEMPGVGAVSGALLNLAFIRRVDVTARRVFQERRLRDSGKVERIEPAEASPRALAAGWAGVLARAIYSGAYCVGYAATLPAWLVASRFRPMDNALTGGARDGGSAADEAVGRAFDRVSHAAQPALAPGTLTPAAAY